MLSYVSRVGTAGANFALRLSRTTLCYKKRDGSKCFNSLAGNRYNPRLTITSNRTKV